MVIRVLPEEMAKNMPRKEEHGAVVQEVVPNSPAAAIGIRAGDRVVGFAGQPVGTPAELQRIIMDIKGKRFVFITYSRDGQNTRLVMKLPAAQ
jgi:serine protease Do